MLNWPADYKATLGNDVRLIARAKRVFAHALDAIEEELLESVAAATAARPPKKPKPTVEDPTRSKPISMMSMAMSEGFSGVTEAVEDDDDDDGETTAHKIDKLRALKGQERAVEMAKYFENGRFSLLKLLSVNRKELKPAFILGRRILSDLSLIHI